MLDHHMTCTTGPLGTAGNTLTGGSPLCVTGGRAKHTVSGRMVYFEPARDLRVPNTQTTLQRATTPRQADEEFTPPAPVYTPELTRRARVAPYLRSLEQLDLVQDHMMLWPRPRSSPAIACCDWMQYAQYPPSKSPLPHTQENMPYGLTSSDFPVHGEDGYFLWDAVSVLTAIRSSHAPTRAIKLRRSTGSSICSHSIIWYR